MTSRELRIAHFLIGNLDDRGYLDITVGETASILQVESAMIEAVLGNLQQLFEPAGIAARDLKECLKLQLERGGESNRLLFDIVDHHLEDLAMDRHHKVGKALGAHPEQVQIAFANIRTLNPEPGACYKEHSAHFIVPDVIVKRTEEGYSVTCNEDARAVVRVNTSYISTGSSVPESPEWMQYVRAKANEARWIQKGLEQRYATLRNVTEAIVDVQRDYLDNGPGQIKPMTLHQIADKLGIHESTVSRATRNKYAVTPNGVIELKSLFGSAVRSVESGTASAHAVKHRMRTIIEAEDKNKPYSDQELADILFRAGISISRRTITKYREEMRIASSLRRKF
jgi:RNA polymerase sigma-54 factor